MIEAVRDYNPEKGIAFSTFAFNIIYFKIIRCIKMDKWYYENRDSKEEIKLEYLDTPVKGNEDITYSDTIRDNFDYENLLESINLQECLNKLDNRIKKVIECVYIKDMTKKEIAVLLNVSQSTVSRDLRIGLAQLKEEVA